MSHYHYSAIIIVLVISLTFARSSPTFIKDKLSPKKNDTQRRLSAQVGKIANIANRFKPANDEDQTDYELKTEYQEELPPSKGTAHVVVLTSLSGVYVWWPSLFGGDNTFELLLSQDDVPRFHDVIGDEHGHIYLTAPHERTVYRLQYSDGWWISNFSNHSVMNSIRSELPLFLNIHQVSSILYVYGHSDIQTIDLLQRPRARGSAPFMKRLRELSPNLHISDLIIDQLTSDGYIIGDSYGWCTVIRCSLSVNECEFLFKIPSSYDNRPYSCTATIDFINKIMYLSLEEKIIGIHLNEQTNFDRRFILTEKRGPRSTLGFDDIIAHNNTILYTDVLRPLLHICTPTNSNPCINISLAFSSPQRTILPLRLSIIQAPNFRPPAPEKEEDTENLPPPESLIGADKTTNIQSLMADTTTPTSHGIRQGSLGNIWMLLLGVCVGLILSGLTFMIYYITWHKRIKAGSSTKGTSSTRRINPARTSLSLISDRPSKGSSKSQSSDSTTNHLLESNGVSSSSEWTTIETTSSSYRPDTIL